MLALHSLVDKVDAFQSLLVATKLAFTKKSIHAGEASQLAVHMPVMNPRLQRGANMRGALNSRLGAAPAAMPYEQ